MESVQVFVNDSLVGLTPVELNDFPTGTYNIKFISDTLVVKKYNVAYTNGQFREITGIFNKGFSMLTIYSQPINAEVFMDDSLFGRTPINKKYIKAGVYNMSIKTPDHQIWSKRIILHSKLYQYNVKLKNQFGQISFFPQDSFESFTLDNKNLISEKVSIGKHMIRLSSEKYHKAFEEDIIVFSDNNYNISFKYNIESYTPLYTSLLVPGLGQINDNSNSKGTLIMMSNLLFSGISIWSSIDYNSKYDFYLSKMDLYRHEENEFNVLKIKKEMKNAYNDANTMLKIRNYSIGAFLVTYIYNLVDAYFNHSIGGKFIISSESNFQKTSSISFEVEL